ncbi:hypothetical protein HO173_000554 [Letharia columbiana]|uniref:Uncharacterized protein n=1 Tax=Letharia columbiana TaxID=112416 RepID=A0A8H6LAV8_9LECA|nr:uncharacterized protein HO173_000554 [Letharia columbiana]KAF6241842.1 hypothetical protein HO173_000554 [Letharia columbiana]
MAALVDNRSIKDTHDRDSRRATPKLKPEFNGESFSGTLRTTTVVVEGLLIEGAEGWVEERRLVPGREVGLHGVHAWLPKCQTEWLLRGCSERSLERNLFLCIGWVSHRAAARHGIVKEGCRAASNGRMIGFFRQQACFGFSPTPKTGTYEYPDSQYHGIQSSHEPQHGDCVSRQPLYTPEGPHPSAASIVALTSKQLPTQAYSPESEWSRTIHTRRISMLPTNPTHNKPALMINRRVSAPWNIDRRIFRSGFSITHDPLYILVRSPSTTLSCRIPICIHSTLALAPTLFGRTSAFKTSKVANIIDLVRSLRVEQILTLTVVIRTRTANLGLQIHDGTAGLLELLVGVVLTSSV